jgi:flagellum-specific peptidoglycan hydrolase FlgJ
MIKRFLMVWVLIFGTTILTTLGSFSKLDDEINYQNLYNKILECGIKYPDIVFAQAVLETGHFRSDLFQKANNLFGMKLPSKRETVAIGKTNGGYAVFPNWESSVIDYGLWQSYMLDRKGNLTRSQYLRLLDRIYSESKGYTSKVRRIITQHQDVLD